MSTAADSPNQSSAVGGHATEPGATCDRHNNQRRERYPAALRRHDADTNRAHQTRNYESDTAANHSPHPRWNHDYPDNYGVKGKQATSVQGVREGSIVCQQLLRTHEASQWDETLSM